MPRVVDAADAASPLAGLLACLRAGLWGHDAASAAEDCALLAKVRNWDPLVRLAVQHDVASLALRGLRTFPRLRIGGEALARLQRQRTLYVRTSLRQVQVLAHTIRILAARDIPCLVLKGVPLAQRLYGDACARRAADIDILVGPETVAGARAALVASDYRPRCHYPETPSRRRWQARAEKAETFHGRDVHIELHQRLLANPSFMDAPFAALFERRSEVRIAGIAFPILDAEDELLYLMCHGSGHGWRQLKWLCDVALCLRSMDGDRVAAAAARAEAAGIGAAWGSMLLACRDALGLPLAGADLADRRAALVAAALPDIWRSGRMPPLWRKVPLRIALKPTARFALHELSRWLVETDDWRRVQLPDRLFYLYFLLRPVLWANDALRGAWRRRKEGREAG